MILVANIYPEFSYYYDTESEKPIKSPYNQVDEIKFERAVANNNGNYNAYVFISSAPYVTYQVQYYVGETEPIVVLSLPYNYLLAVENGTIEDIYNNTANYKEFIGQVKNMLFESRIAPLNYIDRSENIIWSNRSVTYNGVTINRADYPELYCIHDYKLAVNIVKKIVEEKNDIH